MGPTFNFHSIKERDRTTLAQRVGMVATCVALVLFTGLFNLELWDSGYISPYMIIMFVFGVLVCPIVSGMACTKEYNGKIKVLDRGCYCANCQTDGVLERYQKHIGREETGRDRDWLGRTRKIHYVDLWEEREHCLGCGLDSKATAGVPNPAQHSSPSLHQKEQRNPAVEARNKAIFELLKTDQFGEAEAQIRDLIRQNSFRSFDMELAKFLDQALNGQGRKLEADAVADNLRANWKRNLRNEWIAAGRPMKGAVHSRVILNHQNDYHVLAKQYYEPEMQTETTNHFKILAFPKDGILAPNRLFKLEETVAGGNFVLTENFTERASETVKYYETLVVPDIREVAGHVVERIDDVSGTEAERRTLSSGRTILPQSSMIRSVAGGHLPVSYAKVVSSEEDDDATIPVCDLDYTETTESSSSSDSYPQIV